jgi:hypothetical protein
LHVDVFVVVLVERCGRSTVSQPEVDRIGRLFKGRAGKEYCGWYIREEGGVFGAEGVVFLKKSIIGTVLRFVWYSYEVEHI